MKPTQLQWVVKQLKENGQVSRNEALKHYISRLGAIVCSLKKAGWNIEGRNEHTLGGHGRGLDYVYRWQDYKLSTGSQDLTVKV